LTARARIGCHSTGCIGLCDASMSPAPSCLCMLSSSVQHCLVCCIFHQEEGVFTLCYAASPSCEAIRTAGAEESSVLCARQQRVLPARLACACSVAACSTAWSAAYLIRKNECLHCGMPPHQAVRPSEPLLQRSGLFCVPGSSGCHLRCLACACSAAACSTAVFAAYFIRKNEC
jgi:hypothetical protein